MGPRPARTPTCMNDVLERQPDRLDPLRRRRVAAGRRRRQGVGRRDQRDPAVRARTTAGSASRSSTAPTPSTATTTSSTRRWSRTRSASARRSTRRSPSSWAGRTARAVRATGVTWDFAPVLDTERDLRWGRSYEPFGEDPLLTGALGAATIRGLQGRNLASPASVAATAKHFVGYSAPDSGFDRTDATIADNELQNIHLPSFQAGHRRRRRDRDGQQRLGQRRARPRLAPHAHRHPARPAALQGRGDLRLAGRREPDHQVPRRRPTWRTRSRRPSTRASTCR